MRRFSLVSRVGLLASVVALVVGVIVAAALLAILSLRRAEQREARAKDVTVSTLRVQTLAIEIQSSLRGYVLSRNQRFITTYHQARAQLPGALSQLDRLVVDDPIQLRRAHSAAADLNSYIKDYVDPVIVIAKISPSDARGQASGDEDKRRTQQIRATLTNVLQTENLRSQRRAVHTRAVARTAVIIGVVGLAGSALLVLLFGAWVASGVAAPLRRTAAAATDVARGDLSVRLDEGGAGEVGTLVSAFNSMARSLEVSRRELLLQNERLRESEQHKRDLISMVSHELRTPLSAVLGFTSLLLERDFPHDEQQRYLEIVDTQARRLASLAGDFLDVQLLEGGGFELDRAPFDLVELAREQTRLFFSHTELHELELDLPDEPLIVDGDRDRLAQVVGNLLSNAIKYSPEGGVVRVHVGTQGGRAVFSVSDSGLGIPPEDRERVFDKFFRGAAKETTVGGTGLGLAVAREIVDTHGGSIAVDSSVGHGSTFTFELPLALTPAVSA
ncbi:MAG TPA: ATP-binding protein [Gaiellaceae bacterium]|nr:ATP-binding protein [Gaiellaceae bacterium]